MGLDKLMLDCFWTVIVRYLGICVPRDLNTGHYCLEYTISLCPPRSSNCIGRRFEAFVVVTDDWIIAYQLFELPPPPPRVASLLSLVNISIQ